MKLASLLLALCLCAPALADPRVVRDSAFQANFERREGWLGADGAYSLALPDGRVLWLFSDTVVGKLEAQGSLAPEWTMLHNSWGLQTSPDAPLQLHPQQPFAGWYWVYAGLPTRAGVLVFLGRFETCEGPEGLNFRQNGCALACVHIAGDRLECDWTRDVPHFRATPALNWGAAVLEWGGQAYVYGTRDFGLRKEVVLARTPRLDDFAAWRFWDGRAWVVDPGCAVAIVKEGANELSVDGGIRLVTQVGDEIRLHRAQAPWGPYSAPEVLYKIDEPARGVFTYNAKAHPEQSGPGWLLTYNRNVLPPELLVRRPELYRPQCLRVLGESR